MPGADMTPKLRTARVQYLAIEKNAADLFKKGHTLRSAYRTLSETGKISMSYATFRRYALGLCGKKRFGEEPAPDKESVAGMPATPPLPRRPRTAADATAPEAALPVKTVDSAPRPRGPIITGADKKEGFGKDKIALEDLI